ncbi:hypothetical protein RJ639_036963 [Escallonia herrerae]|uniref:RNase H type-1 domain-containing protein n=1 Tax=Escallonia herrerae TaxID=1293975 RepID=A0AA88WPU1_9ASTE|nr:hypothetical protein RJ639_036963 [Escallonia herrerae]
MASCQNKANETLMIEDLRDEAKVEKSKPAEDLMDIELYPGNQEKIVRIGIGRVTALGRFMSKSVEGCLPFFKAIRKAKDFVWTEECQKSFEELKRYLSSPSLLTKPVTGEYLFIYLSISESKAGSSGAGLILISPEKFMIKYAIRFNFQTSNNETEYEALLAGIRLAHSLRVDSLSVHSDSQLVMNHILDVSGTLPLEQSEACNLRAKAARFALVDGVLYKKSFSLPYIKCLSPKEAGYALREVHEGLSIYLRFTSVAHPQSNGRTENMNRSLLQGLKRKLDDAKGAWVDGLPKFFEAENEVSLRGNLDLLDDVRAQALSRMISTKQRVMRHYNQRVRMRIFRVGDLVLRKLEVSDPKAAIGKLLPNWERPYKVSKGLRPGAYSLETLSGEAIPLTWNAKNLWQYYQ